MLKKIRANYKKILIISTLAFAVYTLAGFFLLPLALKAVLIKNLSASLHRQVSVESVKFNPFSLSLTVTGLSIKEPSGEGTFASIGEIFLNWQGRSLLRRTVVVKELRLSRPSLSIVRNNDMSYNFSDLIPKPSAGEKAAAPSPGLLLFSVNNIRILDGSVVFNDTPKKVEHRVTEISAAIPFISDTERSVDTFVEPSFSAKFNGTAFNLKGETKPFADSLETSLNVDIKDLNIPYYLAYAPFPMDYRFVSGRLNVDAVISYRQYKQRSPSLTVKGAFGLDDVEIQDIKKEEMISLPSMRADVALADVFARRVILSSLVFQSPRVSLIRDEKGVFNLKSLIPSSGKESGGAQAAGKEGGPVFALEVQKIELKNAGFTFYDRLKARPFKRVIEPFDCTVESFSTMPDKNVGARFAFRNKANETLLAEGVFSINPVSADLKLDAKGIEVAPLQSYIDDALNIEVTKGRASTSGALAVSQKDSGMQVSYKGGAALKGFASVDKRSYEDFVRLDSLALNGMEIGTNPVHAAIKGVVISNLSSSVIIDKEGRLNLSDIMVKTGAEKEPARPEAKPPAQGPGGNIKVEAVTIKGGRVVFKDRHIEPNFTSAIEEIDARVSGLYLDGSKVADLSLTGKIDRYAPIEVSGKINPKKDEFLVDMAVAWKDFDLSAITPYSGRYIGYKIEKGKIFLDLKYLINKRTLDASNNVLIDQITLGDAVESPDAPKLPVKLAIALLKNRKGEIALNVPVTGSLDDPEFRVGGIIFKIIINLIEKAATAPFALLGNLLGGGEDISYIEFAPGSHAIDDAAAKKLDALTNALYERPGLKLDIEGYADVEKDTERLRDIFYWRKIKTFKLRETGKEEQPAQIDDVVVGPDEYEKYLWMAYKAGKFTKEKNMIGMTRKQPAPEMERLLRENTEVTQDDLKDLASGRAQEVKDYILKSGKVEPERIFTVWPESLTPEKKENLKDSRVDFKLK